MTQRARAYLAAVLAAGTMAFAAAGWAAEPKPWQLGMQQPAYRAGPLGTSEVCLRSFSRKLRRMIPEARLDSPPPPGWSA